MRGSAPLELPVEIIFTDFIDKFVRVQRTVLGTKISNFDPVQVLGGARCSVVVKALGYKPEGREFETP
jgi:hypothetical protein